MRVGRKLFAGFLLSVGFCGAISVFFVFVWLAHQSDLPQKEDVSERRHLSREASRAPEQQVEDTVREVVPVDLTARGHGDDSTRVAGTVFLQRPPTPAPGAKVAAIRSGTHEYVQIVVTDDRGDYEILGLRAGKYWIQAWRDTWTMERRGRETPIDLRSGERIDGENRVLVPGGDIRGRVVEEGTIKPLEGIHISSSRLFTTTDSEGAFVLKGVPSGRILLAAKGERHAFRIVQTQVNIGEEAFVLIELPPGGMIRGTVTDANGRPADGVSVETRTDHGVLTEVTDKDGDYRLSGVPLDTLGITVRASYHGRNETKKTIPGFPVGKTEILLDVELEGGLRVAGRVLDWDLNPLADAKLYIDWESWNVLATSGGEGSFRIDGVSEHMGILTARHEGYAPASVDLRGLPRDDRESIELIMSVGHTVGGRVIDSNGEPVPKAWVYVATEERHAGPYASIVCDDEGRFLLEDLPKELKEIGVLAPGYMENRGNPVEAGEDEIELVLEPWGVIDGFVVDKATGDPVSPFTVKVAGSNKQGGLSSSLVRRGIWCSSDDGGFTLRKEMIPQASYELLVIAKEYAAANVEAQAWPLSENSEAIRIELERGETIDGQVLATPEEEPVERVRVHYVSTNAAKRHGDRGWKVFEEGGRTVRTAVTDSAGEFVLYGVRREPGTVLLKKVGYARTKFVAIFPSSETQTFQLPRQSILEGTVMDANATPLKSARVRVVVDGQSFDGGLTDREGRYSVAGLPPGNVTIEVAHGTLKRKEHTTLNEGELRIVDIWFPGGVISGRVTLAGHPVPEAIVDVTNLADSEGNQRIRTDSVGEFRVEGLKPGTYKLRASPPTGHRGLGSGSEETVEVTDGETVCELAFQASRLTGHVVDESGLPISVAFVQLLKLSEKKPLGRLRQADEDNWLPYDRRELGGGEHAFEFRALEAGIYLLAASRGRREPVGAWAGPFELSDTTDIQEVELRLTGGNPLSVTASDAKTGAVLPTAWAYLRPSGRIPIRIASKRDGCGRAVFNDVPPGRYTLTVDSPEHFRVAEEVDLTQGNRDLAVALQPASWIVVQLRGTTATDERREVVATLLSGGDPKWEWVSPTSKDPRTVASFDPRSREPRARLKTHPGEYRIRFQVSAVGTPGDIMSLIDQERVITVPVDDVAHVWLELE